MTRFWKCVCLFVGLLLLAGSLSACAGPAEERLWLKAPGWSRARVVGNTLIGHPAPMALDDAGNVYIFLIGQDNDTLYPHVVALNRQAEILWDSAYEIELRQPAHPRILWDGQGLQLFWLSDRKLYHTRLGAAAVLSEPPVLLSGEVKVNDYDVVLAPDRTVTVWFAGARRTPGLYALPPGDLVGEAALVDEEGIRPDLQYDDTGALHVTWAHYPPGYGENRFFYAAYPDGIYLPGREAEIVEPHASLTSVLHGPRLGLDRQRAYLFWTVEIRTGPEAGRVSTEYVHLPLGQPSLASSAQPLYVPTAYHLSYEVFSGSDLAAGERVSLESGNYGLTNRIRDITAAPVLEDELVIAFNVRIDYLRRKKESQISTAFFQGGIARTYQLLSFTPPFSADPAILSDEAGQLYITWLERGDLPGFTVYFASTAPDMKETLSTLTRNDIARFGGEMLFGLMSGALFLPFVLIWMIVPVVVVGLTSKIRKENEGLTGLGTLISLGLATGSYWAGKLVTLPAMRDYVPFSAWLPFIPSGSSLPLQVGVPLLIAGSSLLAAWHFTYRRHQHTPLFFLLIYVVVDGVLTMAVYGVIFFGAF